MSANPKLRTLSPSAWCRKRVAKWYKCIPASTITIQLYIQQRKNTLNSIDGSYIRKSVSVVVSRIAMVRSNNEKKVVSTVHNRQQAKINHTLLPIKYLAIQQTRILLHSYNSINHGNRIKLIIIFSPSKLQYITLLSLSIVHAEFAHVQREHTQQALRHENK